MKQWIWRDTGKSDECGLRRDAEEVWQDLFGSQPFLVDSGIRSWTIIVLGRRSSIEFKLDFSRVAFFRGSVWAEGVLDLKIGQEDLGGQTENVFSRLINAEVKFLRVPDGRRVAVGPKNHESWLRGRCRGSKRNCPVASGRYLSAETAFLGPVGCFRDNPDFTSERESSLRSTQVADLGGLRVSGLDQRCRQKKRKRYMCKKPVIQHVNSFSPFAKEGVWKVVAPSSGPVFVKDTGRRRAWAARSLVALRLSVNQLKVVNEGKI